MWTHWHEKMRNDSFSLWLSRSSYSATAWVLLFSLLVLAASRAPYLFSDSGAGGLIVTSTPLVLSAMAITATLLVGSGVDLSIGPAMVFVNVFLVKFLFDNQIGTPWVVVSVAIGLGVLVQVIQAVAITLARIEPVIVTLSAFLALSGLNLLILDKPQGTVPNWLNSFGLGQQFLNPMLYLLIIALVLWGLFTRTAFFSNVKLVGANPRTAYVSGIPVILTRIGAHVVSGVLIGLAGLAYTGAIGSGNPGQGATHTLSAVTALVLGGTALAGGKGGVLGSLPGALAVALISFTISTFSLGALSGPVRQLAYGAILVLALSIGVIVTRIVSSRRQGAR